MQHVARVRASSLARFKAEFEELERPLVIEGGALHMPARAWTPAGLSERFGALRIAYKLSSTHQHPNFNEPDLGRVFARGQASFGEFLHDVSQGPLETRAHKLFTGDEQFLLRRREGRSETHAELAALLADAPLPEQVPAERLYSVWAWFSGLGVRTWLHYDNNYCHNINAQLLGRKHCLLFAPSELWRLAPFPLGGANPAYNCSQIDVEAPDARRFPEFASAAVQETTLEPGDLLFIPACWFHSFLHLGDFNANVNYWWQPERPSSNPVTARQQLIDCACRAGLVPPRDERAAELLRALDAAAVARRH